MPTHYRTQSRVTAALKQPIDAKWKGLTLRSLLRRLSRDREIAILLDRRVDPDQEISIETGERTLSSALDEIARGANVAVTKIGNCLILAPPSAAFRLRTLIALRDRELSGIQGRDYGQLGRGNLRHATISWSDLDRPTDIVMSIVHQFGLTIVGTELIPHDMWAGATIPDASAVEALSIVLNQFDLTFEWTDGGAGVRLLAVPAAVTLERRYPLHGRSSVEVLRLLRTKFEGVDAKPRDGALIVRGTLEQHEAVESLLGVGKARPRSSISSSSRKSAKRSTLPLERQSFELQARGVNLRELMEELKAQGTEIRYDEDTLRKAGIDLDHKMTVDIPKLPAGAFFTRLFGPRGLRFHFEADTLIVEPR